VKIGKDILFASYCYIVGGGNHDFTRTDIPIIQQHSVSRGGITIGDGCWLAAKAVVIDGVKIGEGSIVAAGAW